MYIPESFPSLLREERQIRNLSQGALAERAGLKQAHISHFETGRRTPCLRNLCRLADALGCALTALVRFEDET